MHEYELALTYASDATEAAQAHNNLGALLMQRSQPAAAIAEFNAAILANPNEQNSYLGRGAIEYQEHDLDAAFADFSRAAQIAPSPVAYFWLGRTLEDKGDLQSAVRAYEAALQIAPAMNDARTRLECTSTQTSEVMAGYQILCRGVRYFEPQVQLRRSSLRQREIRCATFSQSR